MAKSTKEGPITGLLALVLLSTFWSLLWSLSIIWGQVWFLWHTKITGRIDLGSR